MKVIIITQNERMFLPMAVDYFVRRIPYDIEIAGVIVLSPSPYGKRKTFLSKVVSTLCVFGPFFVIRYGLMELWKKLKGKDVVAVVRSHGLKVIQTCRSINDKKCLSDIRKLTPDLLISITGNQIFKKPLLDIPPLGTLNLHTALLPKYRGLMPSFWVLKNEEKETGVSVFFVDEGIDSGPIIVQKKINIENMTQWELIRATKFLGVEAIIEALKLINSNKYSTIENDDNDSTYFSFPTRKDVVEFKKKGKKFF